MSDVAVGTAETEQRATRPKETLRRLVQGDLASLRVVIGLALIWAIFQFENDRFLSAQNLTNLMLQITAIGLISVGVVYVLLLGEIDLSVGAVSGLRFVVPSFVVTLAGLLAWQGALLQVLGSTGSINLTDPKITGLANTFYSDAFGWVFAAVVIATYGAILFVSHRRRVAAGLAEESLATLGFRFGLVAVVTIVAVAVLNSDRGVPLALLILIAFVVGMEYVVKRTGFGRHVFAVGGNAEAARRAGIGVNRIRVAVFGIAGTMAAIGGIMAASRLLAVNQNSGGNELLLLAIAGPVIAGTSLFGGRGSVWTALMGALVIGSISNGMDLLALSSAVKFMVTGGVLLLAVLVDAVARQQRQGSGRA
jgi:D-xylose transport system permease protein